MSARLKSNFRPLLLAVKFYSNSIIDVILIRCILTTDMSSFFVCTMVGELFSASDVFIFGRCEVGREIQGEKGSEFLSDQSENNNSTPFFRK